MRGSGGEAERLRRRARARSVGGGFGVVEAGRRIQGRGWREGRIRKTVPVRRPDPGDGGGAAAGSGGDAGAGAAAGSGTGGGAATGSRGRGGGGAGGIGAEEVRDWVGFFFLYRVGSSGSRASVTSYMADEI